MITLANLPDLKRVEAGVMLATIKGISYAVEHSQLEQACRILAQDHDSPAMTIKSAILKTATLIETHHPGQKT